MRYRISLRKFDIKIVEDIIRYSTECYYDIITGRHIIIGRHKKDLVMVPFESDNISITPVTIHTTSRNQINTRCKSGRLRSE